MKHIFPKSHTTGIALVEVIIGAAIVVTGVLALIDAYTVYLKYALANDKNVQAAYLVEEGLEAVGYMRDYSWGQYISPLVAGTDYYLVWDGAKSLWVTTTSAQYVDGVFLRTLNVEEVYRDANDRIAASGNIDTNTKKVSVTVEYPERNATTTKSMTTFITNLYAN